ncbi:MAG: hypothetical protein LUG45_03625, partial [Clostridiales bacterium]|nr:hypothetical protein [Clostridiales bacterium]
SPISWRDKKWGPPGGQERFSFIHLSLRKNLKLMALPFRGGRSGKDGGNPPVGQNVIPFSILIQGRKEAGARCAPLQDEGSLAVSTTTKH